MEEAAFLVAVQRLARGIEIKRDLRRRLLVRIKEQIDEQRLHRIGVRGKFGVARGLRPAQFHTVQRALAGQRRAVRPTGCQFAGQHCHHRIVAQFVVVDQVLVAQRDADHALHHQRLHVVFDKVGIARIGEAGGQTPGQSDHPVRGAEQQPARIRSDPPAVERGHNGAAFHPCKIEQFGVALCRHRGTPPLSGKALLQKNFRRIEAPMHLLSVRNAGYLVPCTSGSPH